MTETAHKIDHDPEIPRVTQWIKRLYKIIEQDMITLICVVWCFPTLNAKP